MYRFIRFGILLSLSLLVLPVGSRVWAQAVDYNLNTQMIDLRSTGSTGNPSDLNPGFNPCVGGTRDATGTCVGGTGLLQASNLNNLFPSLGPGAVTDNMFGLITDATISSCADGSVVLTDPAGLVSGLNCGDLHFDPTTQGVVIPAANNPASPVNDLTAEFTTNTPFTANFCADGATDCVPSGGTQLTAAHVAFELTNTFTWNPTSTNTATVTGAQTMHQVTALNTTPPNTIGGPTPPGSTVPPAGTGDQEVNLTVSFTNTSNAGGGFTNPTVQWTSLIKDPDMSGSGPGFTQNISGSFVYNNPSQFISTQYPSGPSQTLRSQGIDPGSVTPPVSESLP
jgi:hypothetical protein